jgi:hypothetical protein
MTRQMSDLRAPKLVLAGHAGDIRTGASDPPPLHDGGPPADRAMCQASSLPAFPLPRIRISNRSACCIRLLHVRSASRQHPDGNGSLAIAVKCALLLWQKHPCTGASKTIKEARLSSSEVFFQQGKARTISRQWQNRATSPHCLTRKAAEPNCL